MAKDYDKLSDSEQELMEAMKAPPEEETEVVSGAEEDQYEPQEQTESERARDEKGRFAKKEGDEPEGEPEAEEPSEERQKPEPGYVPLKAVHEERERRREAEGQLAELQRQVEELRQAQQQPIPQQQAPEEPPDPLVDKAGYDAYWRKQLEEVKKPYQEFQQQQERQQQVQQQIGHLRQYAASHEQQFRQEHADKDYDGALEFMRDNVKRTMRHFGLPEDQAAQAVAQEEVKLTAMAYQQGISPAALIYNLALDRGFSPRQAQGEADRVQRLGEAQRKTKTGAGASGSPRNDEYTVEDLAAMSEAELAKVPAETIRRVMGG